MISGVTMRKNRLFPISIGSEGFDKEPEYPLMSGAIVENVSFSTYSGSGLCVNTEIFIKETDNFFTIAAPLIANEKSLVEYGLKTIRSLFYTSGLGTDIPVTPSNILLLNKRILTVLVVSKRKVEPVIDSGFSADCDSIKIKRDGERYAVAGFEFFETLIDTANENTTNH